MAEHKTSGYAASLWQALFASFIQLFSRIFPFTSTKNPPQKPRQPSSTSATTHDWDSSSLSVSPPNPHPHPHPSPHLQTSQAQSTTQPSSAPPPPQQHHHQIHSPFIDLEQGVDTSPQDDTMTAAKKRNQKRGGTKSNGPKAVNSNAPYTGPPDDTTSKSTTNQYPVPPPAVVTPLANQGNTRVNSQLPDSQVPKGNEKNAWDRGSSLSKAFVDVRKENVAPPKDRKYPQDPPKVSLSQSPALKPLAAENQVQPQKAGTCGQHATPAITPFDKPQMIENIPLDRQAEEVSAGVDRLTLDGVSGPEKPSELKIAATPVALKAPTVAPTPIVVALPLTDKAAIPKPTPPPAPNLPGLIEPKTEEERVERANHLKFMREALAMGNLALNTNETPVGCVLVHHGRIIAKGMNATNVTRNGTRHAEFMALSALLSQKRPSDAQEVSSDPALDDASWGDVDPSDGHIFPYGQKLHPAPVVDRNIISDCILYVTVEPCVMCASLLRQLGVKKVYFGAVNDKFGGTGGVFKIHMNSKPVPKPTDRPYQNGYGPQDVQRIIKGKAAPIQRDEDDGDGGNVESGFPVEGGYLRDEAVSLLRRFYVQENGRAPQPRKKEGRAARLYAMENQAKNGGSASEFSDPDAPMDAEARGNDGENDDNVENVEVINGDIIA
ncbi:cytidine deaminase-like protein [Hypoxylon trugodes]|uniref:cytidine deaminase-like protein n=1 Tax=Hypoxylon trugodes TaxID=326681 RepID=UPI00219311E3|nr:cytidine deaminase-like protein [Hypoxylon trugodes]KAI1392196.1 cytidine deaminase-like protein [Hypoxylon trugodes]